MNRKEIKATAKMRMAQSEPRYWNVMLVWLLAGIVLPGIAVCIGASPLSKWYSIVTLTGIDPEHVWLLLQPASGMLAVAVVLSVIVALYQIILDFGLSAYSLRLYRGEPCGFATLFSGFGMAGRVLGARILVGLFSLLWSLALMVVLAVVLAVATWMPSALMVFLFFAAYIGYFVALVAILLRYSMVMLVLADQPELGALGAIRRSKELMQGYKGSYILLSLSFLGWGLLFLLIAVALAVGALYGILFLGGMDITFLMGHFMLIDLGLNAVLWLGMLPITLWLEPYIMVSVAGFYEMLQPSTNQEELPLL